jgi:hypothetical protein
METGCTLDAFLFEKVLCWWGAITEIMTNNGAAFIIALNWLEQHFGIQHIQISAYNS